MMRVVIIESPFNAPTAELLLQHARYLDLCILDCLRRGETPYASHKMLTGALDDSNPEERELGIRAGFEMREALASSLFNGSVTTVIYGDFGISVGMQRGIEHSRSLGIRDEKRSIAEVLGAR